MQFPNVYGIDMPTRKELLATGRTHDEIAAEIGADEIIYQELDALEQAVTRCNFAVNTFESSCFSGQYVTGDIDAAYLDRIEAERNDSSKSEKDKDVDLNVGVAEQNLM